MGCLELHKVIGTAVFFRIDLLTPALLNVLFKDASAFFADPVRISINRDAVTFGYTTGIGDLQLMTRPAIERYRVRGGAATREEPIARSFAGFVDEWLKFDDAEARRFGTPEANSRHRVLADRYRKELFRGMRVVDCPGSPPAREIEVEWRDSKEISVFRITGADAASLRMESVSARVSPSCAEIDIGKNLASVASEPRR